MSGRKLILAVLGTAVLFSGIGCHRQDQRRKLIAIIVPSQDNPYFKAEADAAAERALASASTITMMMPISRTILSMSPLLRTSLR
jgi:ABC-type sugar transport system substrate-binding protein